MAAEEILFMSEYVRFKKNNGKLKLLSDKIIWIGDEAEKPRLCFAYSHIKVQRISPEGSSKIQLQTVLHDGNSYSFHFVNPLGNERKDRDEVKDLLAQLIPAHRNKANKDLEEKTKLLEENPDLYQLYKDLVVSEILTAEEFWSNRSNNMQTSSVDAAVTTAQTIGLSSGFLSEVKPESSGCNELRYNLDADTITAIFKTYPAVKKKHVENVPGQMSEKEFWTKFFQSHFFHRDRQKSSSDLFLECANHDEQEFLHQKLSKFYDRLLDISEESPISDHGYGLTAPLAKVEQKNQSDDLFRRFNHQSSMVLKSTIDSRSDIINKQSKNSYTNEEHDSPLKKARLRGMVTYEDLEDEAITKSSTLKIKDKNQFCQGIPNESSFVKEVPQDSYSFINGSYNHLSYAMKCSVDVEEWQPDLTEVLSSDSACEVLTELSPGGILMRDTSQVVNSIEENTFLTELRQHYNAVSELLRNFWSCFPVTSSLLEDKVERMNKSLEKYRDLKLRVFISSLENQKCGEHLMNMVDIAIAKYKIFLEKKGKTKLN
ncbi:general transcription factor IIH subunit 1-like isoform X2 [Xenia sp. Carnegie-2017]|uniref:general transcription factor IIH subunit 1-like isoform X2 n=1 Tax=Xenia sp. Carnegie-2017 TaxID=2897299 RepID=UPI001F03C82B|nr:general transcription factor IIH subunit 1-like isoform X2 [Xenia sp. Carnegie-2017]